MVYLVRVLFYKICSNVMIVAETVVSGEAVLVLENHRVRSVSVC